MIRSFLLLLAFTSFLVVGIILGMVKPHIIFYIVIGICAGALPFLFEKS